MSLFHGNARTAALIQDHTKMDTYAFDYPGYGLSTGPPSPDVAVGALLALIGALKEAGHAMICLWGHSLGTGVAVKAASISDDVQALILTAPFSHTLAVLPWKQFGVLPHGWTDPFPSKAILEAISTPVMILHGDRDNIIPYSEGELLFKAASARLKSHVRMEGYKHNDLFGAKFPFHKVKYFLEKVCEHCEDGDDPMHS